MSDYSVVLEFLMLFLALIILVLSVYFSLQISDFFRFRRRSTLSAWDPSAPLLVGLAWSLAYLITSGRGWGALAIFVGTHILFYVYRVLQWGIDKSMYEAYVKGKEVPKVTDQDE